MNGTALFVKSLYKIVFFLKGVGRQKSGYFSVMKYFGFITLTRSVNRVSNFKQQNIVFKLRKQSERKSLLDLNLLLK